MNITKPKSIKEQAFKTLQKFILLHILLMEYNQKYVHLYCAFIALIYAAFTFFGAILFFRLICALIIAL